MTALLEKLWQRARGILPRSPGAGSKGRQGRFKLVESSKDYETRMSTQEKHWDTYYLSEDRGWNSWLEHPLIGAHYQKCMMVEGKSWIAYIKELWGRPAARSLDLGCASGFRSLDLFKVGGSDHIEGLDIGTDMVAQAEKLRRELGAPGRFWVGDVNTVKLPPNTYDLIFSCHAFHHFLELEHIMHQVHDALTPNGVFMLEEFVGPTQFQWTDQQIGLVRSLLSLLPSELRMLRSGTRKDEVIVLPPHVLDAASPFEAIRSADIVPLFERHFEVLAAQSLGGTIQHLLYHGIIHNFSPDDPQARQYVGAIIDVEDALINSGLLPADFMLLIGRRKKTE